MTNKTSINHKFFRTLRASFLVVCVFGIVLLQPAFAQNQEKRPKPKPGDFRDAGDQTLAVQRGPKGVGVEALRLYGVARFEIAAPQFSKSPVKIPARPVSSEKGGKS
jgi:hypothetical protein